MTAELRCPETVVAYADVHQAFQIALAAAEKGALQRFYCSVFHRRWFMKWARAVRDRRLEGIPVEKVREHALPFLVAAGLESVSRSLGSPRVWHQWRNERFDRWTARLLRSEQAEVFIGVEDCARHTMAQARVQGWATVLDCPHPPHGLLDDLCRSTAREFGLPESIGKVNAPDLERVATERKLADAIVTTSPLQRKAIVDSGVAENRVHVVPLWGDTLNFRPKVKIVSATPLRVLFVGQISLAKGLPYLFRAMRTLASKAELTLVGGETSSTRALLTSVDVPVRYLGSRTKVELEQLYQNHDVLILPSLYESFGFVAMEAMCCGTPVIVTENTGIPVPSAEWRVPVRNAEAIAHRLNFYARYRSRVVEDGIVAAEFARKFSAERYRAEIRGILTQVAVRKKGYAL